MGRKFGKIVWDYNRARVGVVQIHTRVEDEDGLREEVEYREMKSGRTYSTDCFRLISNLEFVRKGKTLIALVTPTDNKRLQLGVAFCNRGDSYRSWVGRRLAVARALNDDEGEEMVLDESENRDRYASCPTDEAVASANEARAAAGLDEDNDGIED